jgi:hypothetical protein
MSKTFKAGRWYASGRRCLKCDSKSKRASEKRLREADRGEDGRTIVEAINEPRDPVPELLRAMLAEDRASGLPFTTSLFRYEVEWAVRSSSSRSSWREALLWAEAKWRAAYELLPTGFGLSQEPGDETTTRGRPESVLLG